ncbi:MAG: carboxypeptidase-like regulatory domain-containing protein [Bacteroidales bacterium]|nr:carboxypeptidase-like regulatory domain-containing protein [Bacteroidales bacterium]
MKTLLSLTFVLAVLFANAASVYTSDNDENETKKEATVVVLKGKIVDSQTKEPLVGVKICDDENGVAVYTDFDGNFEFKTNSNSKEIKVSYISYEETSVTVDQITGKTIEINQIF